jgi:hypothetical protein
MTARPARRALSRSLHLRLHWQGESGLDSRQTREFRPESRCGGMAEWSMAVVLKTVGIGYDIAVMCQAISHSRDERK